MLLSSCACPQVRDAGNLLTRAGLSLPAVDVDSFQMRYPSAADLVEHLRVGGGLGGRLCVLLLCTGAVRRAADVGLCMSVRLHQGCLIWARAVQQQHMGAVSHSSMGVCSSWRACMAVRLLHAPAPLLQHTNPCATCCLQTMAESNALSARRGVLQRDTALAAAALYQAMFAEGDGSVPASFQVMYMTGWAPHSSQPRPKQRGSATVSFEQLAAELEKQGAVTG